MNKDGKKKINRAKTGKKRRISKKELMRRRALRKKIFIFAVVAAAAILAAIFVPRIVTALNEKRQEQLDSESAVEEVDISGLRHLSFDTLSIGSSEGSLSVEEFSEVLDRLYNAGYVLVDIYDIVNIDEEGNISYKDTVTVPKGRRPLIISQEDVCYPLDSQARGTAEKLVLDGDSIKAQYTDASGQVITGDYDIVPILETFISAHPSFSYDGARAILGVSGYCGVFGYRTTSYFAATENNPYADSGTFDVESERSQASDIAEELKDLGYHFASCGFAADISYGAEYSIVEADSEQWQSEVAPVVGDTDIIILPRQTDIASWAGYDDGNAKFDLLSGQGFRFYFVGNNATPYLLQVRDKYVRQTVYEINTFADIDNVVPIGRT